MQRKNFRFRPKKKERKEFMSKERLHCARFSPFPALSLTSRTHNTHDSPAACYVIPYNCIMNSPTTNECQIRTLIPADDPKRSCSTNVNRLIGTRGLNSTPLTFEAEEGRKISYYLYLYSIHKSIYSIYIRFIYLLVPVDYFFTHLLIILSIYLYPISP